MRRAGLPRLSPALTPGQRRLAPHITDDRDALIDSLLARGATRVNVGQDESEASWTVLADPEGNEFCVLSARDN